MSAVTSPARTPPHVDGSGRRTAAAVAPPTQAEAVRAKAPSGGPVKPVTALVVALGHKPAELESILERFALEQTASGWFRPVFVSDCPDSALFRRHGFAFEYLASYADWCRFQDPSRWLPALRQRLQRIVDVFQPDQILQIAGARDRDAVGAVAVGLLRAAVGPASRVQALEAELARIGAELQRQAGLERQVKQLKAQIKAMQLEQRNREGIERVLRAMHALLPSGSTVLMVSRGDPALTDSCHLDVWHFPQGPGGVYAGYHPADSSEAVGHLEALRARGARYLVFPAAARWWLDHYAGLRAHLDGRYRRLLDHDDCVIFSLVDRTEP